MVPCIVTQVLDVRSDGERQLRTVRYPRREPSSYDPAVGFEWYHSLPGQVGLGWGIFWLSGHEQVGKVGPCSVARDGFRCSTRPAKWVRRGHTRVTAVLMKHIRESNLTQDVQHIEVMSTSLSIKAHGELGYPSLTTLPNLHRT